MITNFILTVLAGFVESLSSVITGLGSIIATVNTYLGDLTNYVFSYLQFAGIIVDPGLLFWCITVLITLLLAAVLFRVGNWLFNKIPLIAGFGWE